MEYTASAENVYCYMKDGLVLWEQPKAVSQINIKRAFDAIKHTMWTICEIYNKALGGIMAASPTCIVHKNITPTISLRYNPNLIQEPSTET